MSAHKQFMPNYKSTPTISTIFDEIWDVYAFFYSTWSSDDRKQITRVHCR